MHIFIQLLLLVAGFVLLIKGADVFVDGAASIADHFHIPQIVIGLTVVAFGTSAPEAAISITSALKGNAGISIGNIIGSNIMNILLIIGITSIILPLKVKANTFHFEMPFVIVVTGVLLALGYIGHAITLLDGIILWGFFCVFFIYLIYISKHPEEGSEPSQETNANKKTDSFPLLLILTVLGLVSIVFGSNVTINSVTELAKIFGLSDRFIGLTVVAFGTSLPELITCIIAARKGNDDIAIGNIVGSNIFNILFVVGTTGLIATIPFSAAFVIDNTIAIGATLLLFLCVIRKRKVSRFSGALMLVSYICYFVYVYCTNMQ